MDPTRGPKSVRHGPGGIGDLADAEVDPSA